jgi:hypothetical protein
LKEQLDASSAATDNKMNGIQTELELVKPWLKSIQLCMSPFPKSTTIPISLYLHGQILKVYSLNFDFVLTSQQGAMDG